MPLGIPYSESEEIFLNCFIFINAGAGFYTYGELLALLWHFGSSEVLA